METVTVSSIDFDLMQSEFARLERRLSSYDQQGDEIQAKSLQHANAFFTRVTEVLEFLVQKQKLVIKVMPRGFYLPNIYTRPHLAVQREGADYDGKYYIVDSFLVSELTTESRCAEITDLLQACRWFPGLYAFIQGGSAEVARRQSEEAK